MDQAQDHGPTDLQTLRAKIEAREAVIGIIGLGYVGLPLAMAMVQNGFATIGIDIDQERVNQLASGRSYILDVTASELQTAMETRRLRVTTDYEHLRHCDVAIICVPTPLQKTNEPDMSYIMAALTAMISRLHRGMLLILESTTYPGTTEELVAVGVQKAGYTPGQDICICFSPERVDPGNSRYKTTDIPKVVGGITPVCTEIAALLYGQVMAKVVPVSSARVAEMVKLLENTFRSINIAFVNEAALMCERMGIDIWEVIAAAKTKPFGFMPFYPGPGIGGHCIPLDPLYLAWKAKTYKFHSRFIELAHDINSSMPRHVITKIAAALNLDGKNLHQAKILLLGMAYKPDINDLREAPSLEIYELLREQGARVDFNDPYIAQFRSDRELIKGVELTPDSLATYDCVVLLVNHSDYDYHWLADHAHMVIDTRHGFGGISQPHILCLGAPLPTIADWQATRRQRSEAVREGDRGHA